MLEQQLAQLATSSSQRKQGQLPPQGQQPPLGTLNAINLRSGRSYENPSMTLEDEEVKLGGEVLMPGEVIVEDVPLDDGEQVGDVQVEVEKEMPNENKAREQGSKKEKETPIVIQVPFPSRLAKHKEDTRFGKFLELVKNLHVTIPFVELIQEVSSYSKFMKEILNKKRSINDVNEIETVAFTEECSDYLQHNLPPKLKDPGSYSIPCTIGTYTIGKALCDLGASISVIPLSVCERLNMGPLKCTNITLQMADRSLKQPLGVLEDVPVKVGKFFIPVDFLVLDMAEDSQIPIILGRPFLYTAGAVIDVKQGKLTLEVGDDKVTFSKNNTFKASMSQESVYIIDSCAIPRLLTSFPEVDVCVNSLVGDYAKGTIAKSAKRFASLKDVEMSLDANDLKGKG